MSTTIHSATEAQEQFKKLPKEVQELLYSDQMLAIIKQIGDKNHLHIDQLGTLETTVGQVMLGFLDTARFPAELVEMLGVDRARADAIAQDVNDLLFVQIREALKAVPRVANEGSEDTTDDATDGTDARMGEDALVSDAGGTGAIAPVTAPPPAPPKPKPSDVSSATEAMLHETTTAVAPATATRPAIYKADPYREPVE